MYVGIVKPIEAAKNDGSRRQSDEKNPFLFYFLKKHFFLRKSDVSKKKLSSERKCKKSLAPSVNQLTS
jgi:hypothetical protein